MKKIKIHRIKVAIGMVAVMLLVACSSGEDAPENPPTPPTDPTESASKHEIPVMFSMSSAL